MGHSAPVKCSMRGGRGLELEALPALDPQGAIPKGLVETRAFSTFPRMEEAVAEHRAPGNCLKPSQMLGTHRLPPSRGCQGSEDMAGLLAPHGFQTRCSCYELTALLRGAGRGQLWLELSKGGRVTEPLNDLPGDCSHSQACTRDVSHEQTPPCPI